ncbi:uncharacterized protein LOC108664323 [Hyalella azteca]|uniref:Uncharacterized protein LOC108664323 n=1 Tax=Hyalella azteca TaxID=294128 RepID=A0A8B7MZJ9_HYAAZ|nr:uncharacterized protein LOC108664323 [Hyalella azteca]
MRVKERLTNTLGCLMQPNAEVEDDTVLIKLHTALETILSSFDHECGLKWCQATSLLDFISWSFSHHQSGCNAATLALALKCTASMAKNELGFKALEESKIIEGLLRLIPSSQENNGAPNSLHDGAPSPVIDHKHIPNLNTMNSSVLHALLTVVLEMLENQAGHSWIISHNLRDKLLLPSLSYPSVFVQRAASAALTILLRSSQYQCEGTIAALTAAHTSGALHLKSSEFLNFYVKVLDDIPFGECEAWLLEAVSSLRLDITKHTIPASNLSGEQKTFDLKFLQLVHEHVGRVPHGDDADHSLGSFLKLVVTRGKALSPSCWVRTLKLTGRWHNALAQRGHNTQLCDAFACLTLHVLLLPVLRVLENTESFENSTIIEDSRSFVNGESNDDLDSCSSAHTKSVMRLLRSCDSSSCAQEELRTLHSWIKQEEKTVTDDAGVWSSASAFRLRLAASALPNISSQECIDRLARLGVASLRSLDRCAVIAGVAVAPDEGAVLASVALIRALVKKHMELVELATVMPLFSNIFLRPSNTRQRAVAILDCLLQFMSESEDLLPDAACVRNMVEVGLCHAAWEVRDSALRLLFPALPYQKYRTELFSGCIQRSTEALLDCTESFVQCTAAQLLMEAKDYDMEGWDWVAAHDWCMRVCCSSAVLEGCDDDAVVAAALRLLGAIHCRSM